MRPDKLLGYGILRDGSEFVEEGASLEVEIQVVAKAKLFLAPEGVSIIAERVFQAATSLLVACHDLFANFLGNLDSRPRFASAPLRDLQRKPYPCFQ